MAELGGNHRLRESRLRAESVCNWSTLVLPLSSDELSTDKLSTPGEGHDRHSEMGLHSSCNGPGAMLT